MKKLLTNGLIYDGTGKAPFIGDILIEGDKILKVAEKIDCAEAEVTDLEGLSVSSGFIDAHSHNDWFAIKKEPLKYFEPFIRQGITSFIAGNCGLSAVGFDKDTQHLDTIGGGLFGYRETTGVYPDAESLFNAIDHNSPCNIALIVGHCTARAGISGYDSRKLTDEEQKHMLDNMEKSLKQGACGLSLGLMYNPGIFAPMEELTAVARLAEKYDSPLTIHPRAESVVSMGYNEMFGRAHVLRALDEIRDMAKGTKMKIQYSHAIFVGRNSFKYKDEAIQILKDMKKEGVDTMFDIYDEVLGVSVITVAMPAWYQALSPEDRRKPFNKFKFAALVLATELLLGFTWKDITVAYVGEGNEKYEGKTVEECAKMMGKSKVDAYLDLCEMSNFTGRVNMGPYSTPQIISDLSKDDMCLFMTDAWVEEHGVQNPAVYDCFPKFLKDSMDGKGDTMVNTIRKMTGAVAERFSIPLRGKIAEGYYADLTVFDENEIKSGTPDIEKAFGIRKVFINGCQILDGDRLDAETLKTSGMAMRRTPVTQN